MKTHKILLMTLLVGAFLAATSYPAHAGSFRVQIGSGHSGITVHSNSSTYNVAHVRGGHNCQGYYRVVENRYWVAGYYNAYWVNTSRWIVTGTNSVGQPYYEWIEDGYWQRAWVPGYWNTSYNRVWVSNCCR